MPERTFKDRADAGRRLAGRLTHYGDKRPVVLALPRGGVPVGHEVSRFLSAPLDVLVARKLGAPGRPELGFGAVAQGGVRILDARVIRALGIPEEYVNGAMKKEAEEVERRLRLLRGGRPEPEVRGRTAILVDDGLATGVTAFAAAEALRRLASERIILAVPVCSQETAEVLRPAVDELVCLETSSGPTAISLFYRDFGQVPDEEVIRLLEYARRAVAEKGEDTPAGGEEVVPEGEEFAVRVPAGRVELEGDLAFPGSPPGGARGVVLFAHGSGSSRRSPRNRYVARKLREANLATLLVDLLTPEEETVDRRTRRLRFDIGLLAERLAGATGWLAQDPRTRNLRVGYFGASTGAGAALVAAAGKPDGVGAVVSRGGRPDLAGEALPRVAAPTLLIVGGEDTPVIDMNREAFERLNTEKRLEIVPGATHLFEEPGALEEVARLAAGWFARHLPNPPTNAGAE